jgi:hypothetical protein
VNRISGRAVCIILEPVLGLLECNNLVDPDVLASVAVAPRRDAALIKIAF